ncbi:UNVERIFIED_CONTAM: hypothetical protein FKN15_051843 [Acipenser sinensis]
MTRERMDFAESKKKLESNVAETEGQIQNQKAENAKKIKELRFAGAELFDKEEEISEKQKVDEEMRQVEEINLVHQQMILSQTENFQAVRAREDVVLAFHMDDTKLLEASEHALEEKLENVAKLKMEIKEIDEEKKRLEESNEYDF